MDEVNAESASTAIRSIGLSERPNIVLITVDCLRRDFVGPDSSFADTPFMDSLVKDGVEYGDMYASATTTTPAVASYMTGMYAERNGVYSLEEARLDESVPTLAEHLSAAGYNTHALVTGPIVGETGLARGFDEYEYRDRRKELLGEWYNTAIDRVSNLEEPFFLYLHLWEIHTPIETPQSFDSEEFGQWPYARTLSALDRSLEDLVVHFPQNTVTALHGDHGESITWRHSLPSKLVWYLRAGLRYILGFDTRGIERRLKRRYAPDPSTDLPDHFIEEGHGENVFDFTTNVPFLLHHPEIESNEVDAQVRQVDIFPTILDLAGIDIEYSSEGESLLPPTSVRDRPAYVRACGKSLIREANWQRAIRSSGMKYVEYPNRDIEAELYDLEADPLELSPIEDPRTAGRLEAKLPSKTSRDGEKLEIDDLLRDLGYK